MKSSIKTLTLASLAGCALLSAGSSANAAAVIGLNPNDNWIGFMNVFNITGGPGYGPAAEAAYQFGSSWGTPDLTATFSGPTLTLGPNQINDPNPYWYTPAGGPGATGNKIMDANMYVETTGVYSGQTVIFTAGVLSDTLANGPVNALGEGWTSVAFIKDFAPDYSSFNMATVPLMPGGFTVTLATVANPLRHVQYGFETIGPDVWGTDVGQFGTVVIIPEPSSIAMLGLGALGLVSLRRRQ